MVQKRPFGNEESYEVSSKHPRQLDYNNQLVSFLESVRAEDTAQQPNISGEVEGSFTESNEKHAGGFITELPTYTEKDSKTCVPGYCSNTSWGSSSMSEEENGSEAPFHLLFSPEYYNADWPIRKTVVHSEDINASLLEFPPQKLVPIGPDFQADIPEWGAQDAKNLPPQAFESHVTNHSDIADKLVGICVIPMPDFGPSVYNDDKVGHGRTDCYCEDSGSVRCVRQHIKEAREKLWRTLGHERFLELGFSDMGEVVADRWSQEEELLFRQVVFSNPMSLGRNFWDHLSMEFHSRAKKDIVSYYFNVFMLQRRAMQNRYDPMNIDSDDDEWQGSDDSGDDEVGTAEEDGDSVVESPAHHDDPSHNEILDNNSHEFDDSVPCMGFNHLDSVVVGCDEGTVNVPETCSWKLLSTGGPNPALKLPGEHLCDEIGDHGSSQDEKGDRDVQDDSCTSDDAGSGQQATQVKAYNNSCHLGSFGSHSVGDSHEFVLEHCDTKVWDVGYPICPKNEAEFLPTCSMIEEVFGIGAWDYMAGNGKGLS